MKPFNVNELLKRALAMTEHTDPELAGVWPRASAVLVRQALERTLVVLYQRIDPPLVSASERAKLICLAQAIDAPLAREVDYTWWALTSACHHRGYELGPTADELRGHIAVVRRLAVAVAMKLEPSAP